MTFSDIYKHIQNVPKFANIKNTIARKVSKKISRKTVCHFFISRSSFSDMKV